MTRTQNQVSYYLIYHSWFQIDSTFHGIFLLTHLYRFFQVVSDLSNSLLLPLYLDRYIRRYSIKKKWLIIHIVVLNISSVETDLIISTVLELLCTIDFQLLQQRNAAQIVLWFHRYKLRLMPCQSGNHLIWAEEIQFKIQSSSCRNHPPRPSKIIIKSRWTPILKLMILQIVIFCWYCRCQEGWIKNAETDILK